MIILFNENRNSLSRNENNTIWISTKKIKDADDLRHGRELDLAMISLRLQKNCRKV